MNSRIIAATAVLATALTSALTSATALASADAATSNARTAAKAGSFTVTASVNDTEPLAGSRIKIKGSVKPAAPGASVKLQLRYADQRKWKTVDTTTLSAASRFKFKEKVTTVRERKYRVVKPAGPHRAAGHSPALKVTVFGWRTLTSLNPALAAGMFETSHVSVGGTSYPDSIASFQSVTPPGPNHIDYNLNRDCKTLEARYGLSDSSPSNGTATLWLVADNVTRYTGSFGLAQSQLVTTDVTNVFRITANSLPYNGGVAVVAAPRVLCSF